MDVRSTIIEQMHKLAADREIKLAPLTDDLLLMESGLDSLAIAVLVADLDEVFGFDPFSTGEGTIMPVTLGEFVKLYENAVTVE